MESCYVSTGILPYWKSHIEKACWQQIFSEHVQTFQDAFCRSCSKHEGRWVFFCGKWIHNWLHSSSYVEESIKEVRKLTVMQSLYIWASNLKKCFLKHDVTLFNDASFIRYIFIFCRLLTRISDLLQNHNSTTTLRRLLEGFYFC